MKQQSEKMNNIVRYDNFFSPKDFMLILEKLNQPKWEYGHGSYRPGHPKRNIPFWMMHLGDDSFFTEYLLNIIEEKTNQKYELTALYCNGHPFGTSGTFHKDYGNDQGRTFLLYANDSWEQEWDGKTVFEIGDTYHYSEFVPNSAIIFPGNILHRAEGTSRSFTGLRKTVAWKLVLK
jgi:hypothetical protein